jgi:hypothetical protein
MSSAAARFMLLVTFLGFAVSVETVSASARVSAPPSLAALVLEGRQVGPGYRLVQRPDGHGVAGLVTLDICGFTFRSESLRTDRLQVNYVRSGAPVKASNEVVRYRPGGSAEALKEVAHAVATCPTKPVGSPVRGVGPLTFRITHIRVAHLLPGAIALRITTSGTVRGKHVSETYAAIYQRRANVLSAFYAFGGTRDARERLALHAAAASALNLRGR